MNNNQKKRKNLGFTLVEMLLVMTIMGILATVVIINVSGSGKDARIVATRASITSIKAAIQTFEIKTGNYPKSIDELTAPIGDSPALLSKAGMVDAWATPFQLKLSGNDFEIRSAGPDKQMGTEDDITN